MSCKSYHAERNWVGTIGVCWGTRECEPCSCGGDEAKCDFYDCVRERAKSSITNGDRIRAMTDEELAIKFAGNECPPVKNPIVHCKVSGQPCYKCWLEWLRQEADIYSI